MSTTTLKAREEVDVYCEDVEIKGHIIDSLMLPKILDGILNSGGTFRIKQITIGQARHDPSQALVEVRAADGPTLSHILAQIADHGAVPVVKRDCCLVAADIAGAFPDDFYSSTNQRTEVRVAGQWVPVENQEMDCGILVDLATRTARCIAMNDVKLGDALLVGHNGVRVFPEERSRGPHAFAFMESTVSTEKPKGLAIRESRASWPIIGRWEAKRCWSAGPRSCTPAAASSSNA